MEWVCPDGLNLLGDSCCRQRLDFMNIMMTIRVTNVKTINTMFMPGVVRMRFESPAGSSRDDWVEIANEKALMMLDSV